MKRSWIVCCAVVSVGFSPEGLTAQRAGAVVSGRIVDANDVPVVGAVVHLETLDRVVVSGADGRFSIDSVVPASHTVVVSAAGFSSRRFRFAVLEGRTRVGTGDIALEVADRRSFVVRGVVTDRESGDPISQVPIRVNDRVVALTGSDGRFEVQTEAGDTPLNVIEARRIGYRPALDQFPTPPPGVLATELTLSMEPAPVGLDEIRVEGAEVELSTGRLADFYRRRDMGLGHFFTRLDIQKMNPTRPSDVLRRVPGVVIITEESVNADPFGANPAFSQLPKTTIQFARSGGYARTPNDRPCPPLVFVNDVRIDHEDFDTITRTRDIAGMEVYPSPAQVPAEYNRMGANCGVIAMWTDGRVGGGRTGAGFQIGAQFVGEYDQGFTRQQLGVQMMAPVFGRFEIRPSFTIIVAGVSEFNAGWQAMLTGAVHPLNAVWPLYVGGGVAATQVRPAFATVLDPPESHVSPVLITGVGLTMGVFRPFAELQSLDPASGRDRTLQLAFGVTVRTSAPPGPRF